jgi:hypothetical protein
VFPHLRARVQLGHGIPHSKDSLSLLMVQYSKETCVLKKSSYPNDGKSVGQMHWSDKVGSDKVGSDKVR